MMATRNENVRIKVFASDRKQKHYDDSDENRIIEVVREQILPGAKAEYHGINVKVKRNADLQPQYLIIYKLRKDTYSAEVSKVHIDRQYNVTGIEDNFNDREDFDDEETSGLGVSYSTHEVYDFVVATPVPEIDTAIEAVDFIKKTAEKAGLKVKKLAGPDASVANYKHYLLMGLKGFVNIGHGYEGGIVLSDGRLRYTWFQSLTQNSLSASVIYLNSCKVFNNPLLPEIMNAGTRMFVGGIINLLIGPSENVCRGFWKQVLESRSQMGITLKEIEKESYPIRGAHGIKGDLGPFRYDKKVGVMAVNNRFVCANNGGGAELIPSRTWIRKWETFRLYYLATDQIALQASNNKYVCAEGGGGHDLVANRNQIGTWETFALRKKAGKRLFLQAFNGQYVCAEHAGYSALIANRNEMGPWETFEFIPLRRVGLIARNGKYVCAEGGGDRELFANRDKLKSWETFTMAELGDGEIALQSHNGSYICAEDGGTHSLIANRNWIRTWEIFTMEKIEGEKIALKACNGLYVSAMGGEPLIASGTHIGDNEKFTLIEIDGNLELEFRARQEEFTAGVM